MEEPKPKDAIIMEIFIAYREARVAFQKTTDADTKGQLEIVRFGLERMLKDLLPLNDEQEKIWDEVRQPFAA